MIKSSNTTSSNLKMKTMLASFGELFKQPTFWLALTITVVAISLLVNLGMWQLSRAEHKQAIQTKLESNQRLGAIGFEELKSREVSTLTGQHVVTRVTPLVEKYILLDNQVFQGTVGYLALQLVQASNGQYMLLERGFVAAGKNRAILPEVTWLTDPFDGEGRLYLRSNNPLSEQLMHESTQPMRIQNLNIQQLSALWKYSIEPFVLQPQTEADKGEWPYPQPWNPVPMSAGKHVGYAVQWFGMALALSILALVWLSVALKPRTENRSETSS